MISNPDESKIISSLGWVDKGNLWILQTSSDDIHKLEISDAKYISLHNNGGDYFSIVHHYDGKMVEISAHSFHKPETAISTIHFENGIASFDGDVEIWKKVPRAYPEYLQRPSKSDFYLLFIDPIRPELEVIDLEWYDDSYDKGYQGVIGAIEVPKSSHLIISVQRDSSPILYDLEENKLIKKLTLSERNGNPHLKFRRTANELWADDYDTLLLIDPKDWRVKKSIRLQDAAENTMQNIGNYSFNRDETLCAVARPFSGDVVALDTKRFKITHYSKLGKQPIEVCLLSNGTVYSRDWQTGSLLKGKLKRKWFT
jgi:hypothetical protein